MKILAPLFLLLFSSFAHAGKSCDPSLLLGIRFVDAEIKPVPLDFCENPYGQQAHVLRAMELLRSISAQPAKPGPGDQGLIKPNPLEYFRAGVKDVIVLGCGNPAQRYDERTIIVCPAFTDWDILTQAEILVHEARHREGGDPRRHVECGAQAVGLEGALACDERYEDRGSYAASAEFYLKLSRAPLGGAVTLELRSLAARRALYYLNCRMNHPYSKLNSGPISCDRLPD